MKNLARHIARTKAVTANQTSLGQKPDNRLSKRGVGPNDVEAPLDSWQGAKPASPKVEISVPAAGAVESGEPRKWRKSERKTRQARTVSVTVHWSPEEYEFLVKYSDAHDRSLSHIIRDAVLPMLGLDPKARVLRADRRVNGNPRPGKG
jgi:hypothetical protein